MNETMTHWEKERIQAQDEIRQFEREQALEQIAMLLRHHEIGLDELNSIMANDPVSIAQ